MKVFNPNIWVITPKNEGCGFPWKYVLKVILSICSTLFKLIRPFKVSCLFLQNLWRFSQSQQFRDGFPSNPTNFHPRKFHRSGGSKRGGTHTTRCSSRATCHHDCSEPHRGSMVKPPWVFLSHAETYSE